ncbi:rhomboid family intramembrane serine protease [Saprospiraceae bacterium]|nr:rhomboid family intramembrane serine protease [Saprospiraceae bacterium]
MFRSITPVVKNLLIINVLMFVVIMSIEGAGLPFAQYLPLHNYGTSAFKPFQLVTTMFTHYDPSHLFFNMIGLFFFGPMLENRIGSKNTLIAYIAGGLFSAVIYLIFYTFIEYNGFSLLGASGAIYTIVVMSAIHFTNQRVQLLIPPIPMKLGFMAAIFITIDIIGFKVGAATGIAYLAHLGGAAMGFMLYYYWEKLKR